MDDTAEYTPTSSRKLMFFGKDLASVPCFRNSWLYGMSGGIAAGLVCFLGTSSPRKSTHTAFVSCMVVTSTYWCFCRYNYEKQVKELEMMKEYVQKRVLVEGTEMEKVHEATDNVVDAVTV